MDASRADDSERSGRASDGAIGGSGGGRAVPRVGHGGAGGQIASGSGSGAGVQAAAPPAPTRVSRVAPSPTVPRGSTPAMSGRWDRSRDLVSIGECLVEMTMRGDRAWQSSIAGDAFNTLFYASRLGLRTGLVSAVGDDIFTPMMIQRITNERIDIAQVQRLPGRRNGIYFIEQDTWGERHFHYWREGSAATETLVAHDLRRVAEYVASSHFLLITGVTLAVLKRPERLIELLEMLAGRCRIAFDPNYRPQLWRGVAEFRARMREILPFVEIYLPSRQDLSSTGHGPDPESALLEASAAGVQTVIMKDGPRGLAYVVGGQIAHLPAAEAWHVVDTTGAGDAFNAGLIAGIVRGETMENAIMLGSSVAARSLMVPGAIDPGFTPHSINATWQ